MGKQVGAGILKIIIDESHYYMRNKPRTLKTAYREHMRDHMKDIINRYREAIRGGKGRRGWENRFNFTKSEDNERFERNEPDETLDRPAPRGAGAAVPKRGGGGGRARRRG